MEEIIQEINIRRAELNDVPTILKLIEELAEYEKLSNDVIATEDRLKNVLFGDDQFVEVYLAEYRNEIAGQVIFFKNFSTFIAKPGLFIEDLYVRPQFRSKGIGKKLLLKVVEIAKERDYGRIEWNVLDWNKPAITFYERIGAVPLNEWITFRLTAEKFESLL